MKRQKFLAVLLSAALAFTPVINVMAEENAVQTQTTESGTESQESNGTTAETGMEENSNSAGKGETTEAVGQSNELTNEISSEVKESQKSVQTYNDESEQQTGMVGGYIPSDLDYNAPVYYSGSKRARRSRTEDENPETKYPKGGIEELKDKYPLARRQGSYGTCWSFASMGMAEFDMIEDKSYSKRYGIDSDKVKDSIDLSELQLVYFTYNFVTDPLGGTDGDIAKYYNENAVNNYLNAGGNYQMSSRRLMQWIGTTKEETVPYNQTENVLTNGLQDEYAYDYDVAHLKNVYRINIVQNATEVKKQIEKHGAVGVSYIHHFSGEVDGSPNTYFDTANTEIGATDGGHAVMIVGWDDNFSKSNFKGTEQPINDGAWLVRNSWGDGYFDYFWMSYETESLKYDTYFKNGVECKEEKTAWVFDFDADDGYDNNYQLDGGIYTQVYPYYPKVANVFSVSEKEGVGAEELKAVSLSLTSAVNVHYTIEIYTNLADKNNPASGTLQSSATTTGNTSYAGVYTIPLEKSVILEPNTSYSIVVTLDKKVMDMEYAYITENGDKTVWDSRISNTENGSFYYNGSNYGAWPTNFCIKAYSTNVYSIAYELDGGTNASDNPTILEKNNSTIVLKEPVKEGYKFDGWYTEAEFANKITEIPENAGQNYTLYAKWTKDFGEKLEGYTATLNGAIDLNFKVSINENSELLKDPDAYMEFTVNGNTMQVKVSDANREGKLYVFPCPVVAKEMTMPVQARFVSSTGEKWKTYTYTVKEYAETILNSQNSYTDEAKNLVKAMLNYGAYAQTYFGFNTDNLANASLSQDEKEASIADVDFSKYAGAYSGEDTVPGISYYGSNLVLLGETNVKDYFVLTDEHNIDDYVFYYSIAGGAEQPITAEMTSLDGIEKACFVEINDIKSYLLNQDIMVTIKLKDNMDSGKIQLKYSPFSYCYAAAQKLSYKENLINWTRALYWYWKAADQYMKNK